MTIRNRIRGVVGAAALTTAVAVTAVVAGGPRQSSAAADASATQASVAAAQQPMPGASATPGRGTTPADKENRAADFEQRLAANLGVSVDQLRAAIKTTALQEVDAAETAGRITPEQAQRARDRINSGTGPFGFGGFGHWGRHRDGPRQGPAGGPRALFDGQIVEAAATALGISGDQLRQDLADLGSPQAVAAKHGKDNPAGKGALQGAMADAIRAELTGNGLDPARVDQAVAFFNQNFERLYTAPLGQHDPFGPAGRPGRLPGRAPSTMPPGGTQ